MSAPVCNGTTSCELEPVKVEKVTVGRCFTAQATFDTKLVALIKQATNNDFQFICYPLGGEARVQYDPKSGDPIPEIGVYDCQMSAHNWCKYVCAGCSGWIDLDAPDVAVAKASRRALRAELDYAHYLGVTAVKLDVPSIHRSEQLAAFLSEYLWSRGYHPRLWLSLRTDDEAAHPAGEGIWQAWRRFRIQVRNHHKLAVCLSVTADLADEFCEPDTIERWVAEPIAACMLPVELFAVDSRTDEQYLPAAHERLLAVTQYAKPEAQLVLAGNEQLDGWALAPIRQLCNQLVSKYKRARRKHLQLDADTESAGLRYAGYEDLPQIPLQPLSDNLASSTYEIFERYPFKYEQYGRAIQAALTDLVARRKEGDTSSTAVQLNVMVLGAGRGPLVTQVFSAFERAKEALKGGGVEFKVKVTAVEKNPNSFVTLTAKNKLHWGNKVRLIHADMRSCDNGEEEKADLIVSEMLGSFGDNELSPECLDGAQHLLKPDAISIPQSYTSYLEPVNSVKMMNSMYDQTPNLWYKTSLGRRPSEPKRQLLADEVIVRGSSTSSSVQVDCHNVDNQKWDCPYVVQLSSCHFWPGHPTRPLFTFIHPNNKPSTSIVCISKASTNGDTTTTTTDNSREGTLHFDAPYACEVSALAGYFHCDLYDGRFPISIEPNTFSEGLFSWFPAVFPLRHPVLLAKGDRLSVQMRRCCDANGVWYEWRLVSPLETPWQNREAHSYYMRLAS